MGHERERNNGCKRRKIASDFDCNQNLNPAPKDAGFFALKIRVQRIVLFLIL